MGSTGARRSWGGEGAWSIWPKVVGHERASIDTMWKKYYLKNL